MTAVQEGLPRLQNPPRFRPELSSAAAFEYISRRAEAFPRHHGFAPNILPGTRVAFIGQRVINIRDNGNSIFFTFNTLVEEEVEILLGECGKDFPDRRVIKEVLFSDRRGDYKLNMTVADSRDGLQITAKSERFGIEDIEVAPVSPAIFDMMFSLLRTAAKAGAPAVPPSGQAVEFRRSAEELVKPGFNPRQTGRHRGRMKRRWRAA